MKNAWMQEQDPTKITQWTANMEERGWVRAGRNWLEYAGGDPVFALWLILCDQRMSRLIQLGIFDIADWGWADAYESDYSPKDAVIECLQDDDDYSSLFEAMY